MVFEELKEMDSKAIVNLIDNLGISEYGFCHEKVSWKLKEAASLAQRENVAPVLLTALNNGDLEGVLLKVLDSPEKVFMGITLAARALEAEQKLLILPEYASDELLQNLQDKAEAYGITVRREFVNIRQYPVCVMLHFVTMEELYDGLMGRETSDVYISLDGKNLIRTEKETRVCQLLEETENIKGFLSGNRFLGKEILEQQIQMLDLGNAVLKPVYFDECIVQRTEKKLLSYRERSCGKCVFCREGLIQLHHMQKEIADGRGRMEYLDLTKEIGEAMKFSTPCSLGQNAADIALTSIEICSGEYEEHIKKKNCPAGECSSFIRVYIDPQKCTGCGDCVDSCSLDCISGKAKYIHMIDELDCNKCGKCKESCEEEAIIITTGKVPKLPDRLTRVGRFKKR